MAGLDGRRKIRKAMLFRAVPFRKARPRAAALPSGEPHRSSHRPETTDIGGEWLVARRADANTLPELAGSSIPASAYDDPRNAALATPARCRLKCRRCPPPPLQLVSGRAG